MKRWKSMTHPGILQSVVVQGGVDRGGARCVSCVHPADDKQLSDSGAGLEPAISEYFGVTMALNEEQQRQYQND